MALWCTNPPEFNAGSRVVSLIYHPPEIAPGTKAVIAAPHTGDLYAIQLPGGELHRWFAGPELEPLNKEHGYGVLIPPGALARIISTEGHPSHIRMGMVVRVVQSLGLVPFYDVMIGGKYHRWLAEFEVASENVVQ